MFVPYGNHGTLLSNIKEFFFPHSYKFKSITIPELNII